jgi:hypothetical protein
MAEAIDTLGLASLKPAQDCIQNTSAAKAGLNWNQNPQLQKAEILQHAGIVGSWGSSEPLGGSEELCCSGTVRSEVCFGVLPVPWWAQFPSLRASSTCVASQAAALRAQLSNLQGSIRKCSPTGVLQH